MYPREAAAAVVGRVLDEECARLEVDYLDQLYARMQVGACLGGVSRGRV